MRAVGVLSSLLLLGLVSSCAMGHKSISAAEMDWAAVNNKMMEQGQPGEAHTRLARLVGTWATQLTMHQDPSVPESMEGTSTFHAILDGHCVQQDFQSDYMGMPFRGMGIMGYDNSRGMYWSTWMDNMNTMIMEPAYGTCSSDGDLITYHADFDNPFTGLSQHERSVLIFESADRVVFRIYASWKGQPEYETLQIVYTRK